MADFSERFEDIKNDLGYLDSDIDDKIDTLESKINDLDDKITDLEEENKKLSDENYELKKYDRTAKE